MSVEPPDRNAAPRRVLMTADGVGGVWTYALDLAAGLQTHGIAVTIATMGPALREDQRADARRWRIEVCAGAFALEWMEDPWTDVDAASGWLLALEDEYRPDVVHLNGYCHGALPWRAPVVMAAHSCVASWWRGVHGGAAPPAWDTYRERVRDGLRSAAVVVAPTRAMLDALQLEHGPVPDGRVIPNGRVWTKLPQLPPEGGSHEKLNPELPPEGGSHEKLNLWLPPLGGSQSGGSHRREPMIFSAGRIWDRAKNISAVCDAAPRVRWPVYVAGDAGESAAPGVVNYLGRLSSDDMRTWYARASIYVLPARYEPFGLSILEAANAGCALVLGDIPSLRENWNGAAAFVDPDDVDGLVAAMNELIDNRVLRGDMSARARDRAQAFSVERMTSAYAAVYDEIASNAALKGPRHVVGVGRSF